MVVFVDQPIKVDTKLSTSDEKPLRFVCRSARHIHRSYSCSKI